MPSPSDSDSTQMPESNIQRDEALDSLGIVVGEIAHEFNNNLSLIFGYVEMALSELPKGQRARSDLEHVLAASDRAKELVARIQTFSKSTKLKREPISIDKPVQHAIDYISARLPVNVKLSSIIEENKGKKILSNETEIYKVINNLCSNSMQAMPEAGGEIEVKVDYVSSDSEYLLQHSGLTAGGYAKITVKDTGCGMSIDTIEKMYLPFFTSAREDDKSENRAGLGLTTVYNIVSSQNGVIYVDSTPNEGTKFEICLPQISTEVDDSAKQSASTPKNSNIRHILFIDDESSIVDMASQILEQNDYTVTCFTDGNDALEHFRQQPHQFDLIITDLTMPAIAGTELATKLSAINPNIPIVLSTGFTEKITSASCEQWGISTVINKPFTIHDLLATIESLN